MVEHIIARTFSKVRSQIFISGGGSCSPSSPSGNGKGRLGSRICTWRVPLVVGPCHGNLLNSAGSSECHDQINRIVSFYSSIMWQRTVNDFFTSRSSVIFKLFIEQGKCGQRMQKLTVGSVVRMHSTEKQLAKCPSFLSTLVQNVELTHAVIHLSF